MRMKLERVVSNSSPLMNLAIIEQLSLVQSLFGRVCVPEEVWHVLTVAGRGKPGSAAILRADWIDVIPLKDRLLFTMLQKDLDDGEAAAIALAIEQHVDLLLLDETDARNVAEMYQLAKTGVIGILMRAKQQRHIQELRPLLERLQAEAHFWIHPRLYQKVLHDMGE